MKLDLLGPELTARPIEPLFAAVANSAGPVMLDLLGPGQVARPDVSECQGKSRSSKISLGATL